VGAKNDELGFEIGKRRCDTLAQDTLVVWPLVLGVVVPKTEAAASHAANTHHRDARQPVRKRLVQGA
jgi:hypothetical protein